MKMRLMYLFLAVFFFGTSTCLAADETPVLGPTETIELPFKNEFIAAFTTGKTLWLVFANPALQIKEDALHNASSRFVTGVKQVQAAPAKVFMVSLKEKLAVTMLSSDTGVQIILQENAEAKPDATSPLSLNEDDSKKQTLHIASKTARGVASFTDPTTGKLLQVVPLLEVGNGFYPGHVFTKFSILQTAQGLAVESNTDDITVAVDKGDVNIASNIGLAVSPEIAEQINNASEFKSEATGQTLFPYSSWKLSDNKNFVTSETKLIHDIAYGDSGTADKSRLRLLGIYLSQGLFVEAEGMANDILRSSYKFYRQNNVAALRGAAYFFMQRYTDAEHNFAAPELANDKEAQLWHSLCEQVLGDDKNPFDFAANYDRYISKYPPVFIQKLALISADYNIKRRDYDKSSEVLGILIRDNLDEPVKKYVDYMRAEILSETKNEEEAQKIWEKQAEMTEDPLIRASAGFSLINMEIRQDKITPEKAIKELEKLRIVWRGDDLELSILTLLGSLYLDQKDYSKALYTLREIVQYYPQSPQTLATAEKMESIFTMLYNKGGADAMPPLDALALFYEFRDLVPAGKDGDMMVRNLAERLVNIDLLDRAEALLNHQVQKRLQGYERSRVGARLAAIYLQNHQTKEALDTLKTTGYGELPPDLQLQRQRLTAKALAAEGHPDKAIEVLNADNGADGSLLRLSIYWETRDWPDVTLTAEEILSNRADPTAKLTPEETGVLLKLATAYVYVHDNGQIQYLRDYFTPLLKDSPDKDSFLFITSEASTLDYTNVTNTDSDITTVRSYLDSVRQEAKRGEKLPASN